MPDNPEQRDGETNKDGQRSLVEDRIALIQSSIESAGSIPGATKADLLKMVDALKSELATLSETHGDAASSITRFAEASAHESARPQKNPQLAETALSGLRISIEGLEESHPLLVATVSRFANALSNMGI